MKPKIEALHSDILKRIELLMRDDPTADSVEGQELLLLCNVAQFYERDLFASSPPARSDG